MNSKKLLIPGKTYRISYEVCSEDTIEDMIIPFLDENVLVSNIQIMKIGEDILLAQTGYRGDTYFGWDTLSASPIRRDNHKGNTSNKGNFQQDCQTEPSDYEMKQKLEYTIEQMWHTHRRKYKEAPRWLICDIDNRFKIMENLNVAILQDGSYSYNGMTIAIVDGLKNNILEVR